MSRVINQLISSREGIQYLSVLSSNYSLAKSSVHQAGLPLYISNGPLVPCHMVNISWSGYHHKRDIALSICSSSYGVSGNILVYYEID